MSMKIIKPKTFHQSVQKMRDFFIKRGFIECHPQSGVSILAACEDPKNIGQYNFNGNVWPLPQTGQMWLEHALLQNPHLEGLFCVTTSYRNEPNPVEGRHERIFPMFEFEMKGGFEALLQMERELCTELGFDTKDGKFPEGNYVDVAENYGVKELEHEHEWQLEKDHGAVFMLKNFPLWTSPFWNMRMHSKGDVSYKCDAIMGGQETIGSAERSVDKEVMRDMFMNISEGQYKQILFNKFGQKRVMRELDQFLSYDFFERSGGGIGITRMISALEKYDLIEKSTDEVTLMKDLCKKSSENTKINVEKSVL